MSNYLYRSATALVGIAITFISWIPVAKALNSEEIYQKTNSAVVLVVAGEKNPKSFGSGFIISPTGYIMTDDHVIGKYSVIGVRTADGESYWAKILYRDSKLDLALIKIEPKKPLQIFFKLEAPSPKVGQKIYIIGNPQGGKSITDGIISRLDENDYIQYTAATNPGNSGGPLLNDDGEVIGIVQRKVFSLTGINFAMSTSQIRQFIRKNGNLPPETKKALNAQEEAMESIARGNYQKAIELLTHSISLVPGDFNIYTRRGFARYLANDFPAAIQDFNQSIIIHPTSIAHYNRAAANYRLNDWSNAISDFTQAITLNQEWGSNISLGDAYSFRGLSYQARKENALAACRRDEILESM